MSKAETVKRKYCSSLLRKAPRSLISLRINVAGKEVLCGDSVIFEKTKAETVRLTSLRAEFLR